MSCQDHHRTGLTLWCSILNLVILYHNHLFSCVMELFYGSFYIGFSKDVEPLSFMLYKLHLFYSVEIL